MQATSRDVEPGNFTDYSRLRLPLAIRHGEQALDKLTTRRRRQEYFPQAVVVTIVIGKS